jgi:transcriptional regulator with XRE-family HTH domain
MARTTETPRSLELGLLLATFRKRAGLSQIALAAQLNRSHSDLSRWENGKQNIDAGTLGAVLGILGVTGDELEEAFEIHTRVTDPNWVALGIDRQLGIVREYEDTATGIFNAQPALVPGPLQTRDYALDVMAAAGNAPNEAQAGADFRMARAATVLGGKLEYEAVIGEYALRYPACRTATAVEQMRHLLTIGELPNVTVRVMGIAARYTPMRRGSFVLIKGPRTAVHLEQLGGSSTLADPRYVRSYETAADILRRDAMSPADTTGLIAELIDEMERTT